MQQTISKQKIGYVLFGFSTVLFLAIFTLLYLHLTEKSIPLAVPLGLAPIAIVNAGFAASLMAKPKP